jgi:hypothetical protein
MLRRVTRPSSALVARGAWLDVRRRIQALEEDGLSREEIAPGAPSERL